MYTYEKKANASILWDALPNVFFMEPVFIKFPIFI